jgi:uncharacterized RDD family membrane protein YckC
MRNGTEAERCVSCGTTMQPPSQDLRVAGPVVDLDYAGFCVRFLAFGVDWLILLVPGLVLAVIDPTGLVGLVGSTAYYILFTGLRGQTPGKMVVGIKVIRIEDGSLPGLGVAALRETLGKFVSALALLLGYLWIAFDPKKQGWHDKMARTVVVVVVRPRARRYRGPVP